MLSPTTHPTEPYTDKGLAGAATLRYDTEIGLRLGRDNGTIEWLSINDGTRWEGIGRFRAKATPYSAETEDAWIRGVTYVVEYLPDIARLWTPPEVDEDGEPVEADDDYVELDPGPWRVQCWWPPCQGVDLPDVPDVACMAATLHHAKAICDTHLRGEYHRVNRHVDLANRIHELIQVLVGRANAAEEAGEQFQLADQPSEFLAVDPGQTQRGHPWNNDLETLARQGRAFGVLVRWTRNLTPKEAERIPASLRDAIPVD